MVENYKTNLRVTPLTEAIISAPISFKSKAALMDCFFPLYPLTRSHQKMALILL